MLKYKHNYLVFTKIQRMLLMKIISNEKIVNFIIFWFKHLCAINILWKMNNNHAVCLQNNDVVTLAEVIYKHDQ